MKKIDRAIEKVKELIKEYDDPAPYQRTEYYELCRGKINVLEDLLYSLEQIKKGD